MIDQLRCARARGSLSAFAFTTTARVRPQRSLLYASLRSNADAFGPVAFRAPALFFDTGPLWAVARKWRRSRPRSPRVCVQTKREHPSRRSEIRLGFEPSLLHRLHQPSFRRFPALACLRADASRHPTTGSQRELSRSEPKSTDAELAPRTGAVCKLPTPRQVR